MNTTEIMKTIDTSLIKIKSKIKSKAALSEIVNEYKILYENFIKLDAVEHQLNKAQFNAQIRLIELFWNKIPTDDKSIKDDFMEFFVRQIIENEDYLLVFQVIADDPKNALDARPKGNFIRAIVPFLAYYYHTKDKSYHFKEEYFQLAFESLINEFKKNWHSKI